MSNVVFKRGPQADLPVSGTTAVHDGTFYLTTDTERLYYGNGTNLSLLNKVVKVVNSTDDLSVLTSSWNTDAKKLAHKDDFYYVTGGNILAVYTITGDTYGWTQINADHNDYVQSVAFSATASATNEASVTLTATRNGAGTQMTANMAIIGDKDISVSVADGKVKISNDPYGLSASLDAQDNLKLTLANSATAHNVTIKASGAATFEESDGQIFINSVNSYVTNAGIGIPSNGTLAMSVTDGVHSATASIANVGVLLNDNTYLPLASTASASGAGSVYSKNEIDSLINSLNGMTYKGVVTSSQLLPTTAVRKGDVWVDGEGGLFASDFTGSTFVAATVGPISSTGSGSIIGDMYIADGTEGSDGYISSGLIWTYIPAGNDSLSTVTYHGEAGTATNTLSLKDGTPLANTIASLTLTASTGINIISTTTTAGNILSATISHETITTTTTTADPLSTNTSDFTAIKGITIENGHVTQIETDTFTPVKYSLGTPTYSSSADCAIVNLTLNKTGAVSLAGTASFAISSNNLSISTTSSSVIVDFEWGTFGSV